MLRAQACKFAVPIIPRQMRLGIQMLRQFGASLESRLQAEFLSLRMRCSRPPEGGTTNGHYPMRAAFQSWPSAAVVGKISDLITTGTAPDVGSMVPMSM